MRRQFQIVPVLAFATLLAAPAVARQADAPFLVDGSDLAAPRGFVAMCQRSGDATDSELCAAEPQQAAAQAPAAPISLVGFAAGAGTMPATATTVTFGSTGAVLSADGVSRGRHDAFNAALQPAVVASGRNADLQDPPLTRAQTAMLKRVNRFVNGHVRQETDTQIYNTDEYWTASGTRRGARGDCEDLAIEKRLELVHAGFPADRLFFAVVYRGDIGLHTLLIARTDEGDVVLDSRTPYVVPWNEAPYSWVGLQSRTDPMRWYRPAARTFETADTLGAIHPGA